MTMAVKEITMYYLVCDNCGHMNDCDSNGFSYIYDNKNQANERLDDDNMIKHNDKHYCNDCWEHDDDDNLIIKNKQE